MHVPGELWEYCFVSSPPDLRSHFSVLYLRRYLFVRWCYACEGWRRVLMRRSPAAIARRVGGGQRREGEGDKLHLNPSSFYGYRGKTQGSRCGGWRSCDLSASKHCGR